MLRWYDNAATKILVLIFKINLRMTASLLNGAPQVETRIPSGDPKVVKALSHLDI